MKILRKIFHYFESTWTGADGKVSIKRLLALIFSIDLVRNLHYSVFQWEIGKSYSDAALLLGIEAGLIAALLSLTTYSTIQHKGMGGNKGYGGEGYGGGGYGNRRHRRQGNDGVNVNVGINVDDAIDEEINNQENG